jgi:hypothetical protein
MTRPTRPSPTAVITASNLYIAIPPRAPPGSGLTSTAHQNLTQGAADRATVELADRYNIRIVYYLGGALLLMAAAVGLLLANKE